MTPVFAVLDAPIIAVIIGAAVLLFGAPQLPKLARSMGLAKKEFEAAIHGSTPPSDAASGEPPSTPAAGSGAPPTPPAPPPPAQQP